MASSPPLAEHQHRERAGRHMVIGAALEGAGDEWCCVPLFYGAYHLVKAAMLADPIWDDIGRLHAKNLDLIATDKLTTRHHGRKQPGGASRQWGVNELVLLLYPQVAVSYEKLHQGSILVRYGAGLSSGALSDLRASVDQIEAAEGAGGLIAS